MTLWVSNLFSSTFPNYGTLYFNFKSVVVSISWKNLKFNVMDVREFPNNFPDYNGQILLESNGEIDKKFGAKLASKVKHLLEKLELEYGESVDWKDSSVYTGTAGVALMYFHLYRKFRYGDADAYLERAVWYVNGATKNLRQRGVSFLCGDAGPLAVAAVVYEAAGLIEKTKDALKRLFSLFETTLQDDSLPDELLFGRAGYLFALLFVQRHLGEATVSKDRISKVFRKIVESGRHLAGQQHSHSPLMYEWHEKKYLGAAHGLTGIMYMLMQVSDSSVRKYVNDFVRPTIDFLMTLKFPSGNYPSSIGSGSGDKLVHWCHGAPGWIYMFIAAYKVFGDTKYLDAAKGCGSVLWSRGLLRKGYGICHGVSGNAYGMLALYNLTHDAKHLYRACKFAEWCFDYNKHGCRTPDRPYSLFEGMAGTIYFLADLINPSHARFPAFQLNLEA